MQYRALRHARINGHDYGPGELIRDPGSIRNARSLIAARYIETAGGGVDPVHPDQPEDIVPAASEGNVTGFLDADEIGKWKREQLEAVASDLGVENPDDKSLYPNKDALIAVMVTIPVTVPAGEDDAELSDAEVEELVSAQVETAEAAAAGDLSVDEATRIIFAAADQYPKVKRLLVERGLLSDEDGDLVLIFPDSDEDED